MRYKKCGFLSASYIVPSLDNALARLPHFDKNLLAG